MWNRLQTTSKGLLLPTLLHLHNIHVGINKHRILVESGMAGILCWVVFTSHIFWANPKKGTIAHKMDVVSVKTTILAFLVYIAGFKRLPIQSFILFWVAFGCLIFFGYASDLCSRNDWCGEAHIFYHSGLHFVGIMLSFYAFAPE